jgi:hypothetical protein
MRLLNELIKVLSGNINKWTAFSSPDRDINYFSDIDRSPSNSPEFKHGCRAGPLLRHIDETFEKLEAHREKLGSLKDSLARDFEAVR